MIIKGLKNNYSDNNCFLNVVIQSFYQLEPFREAMLKEKILHNHIGSPQNTCLKCELQVRET